MPRPKSTDGIQRERDRTSCQRKPLPLCETSDCASEGDFERLCDRERIVIVHEGNSERISSHCSPLSRTCPPSSSQKVDDEEVEHDRAKEKVAKCPGEREWGRSEGSCGHCGTRNHAHLSGEMLGKSSAFALLHWILSEAARTNWPTVEENLCSVVEMSALVPLPPVLSSPLPTVSPGNEAVEGKVGNGTAVQKLQNARENEEGAEGVDEL